MGLAVALKPVLPLAHEPVKYVENEAATGVQVVLVAEGVLVAVEEDATEEEDDDDEAETGAGSPPSPPPHAANNDGAKAPVRTAALDLILACILVLLDSLGIDVSSSAPRSRAERI